MGEQRDKYKEDVGSAIKVQMKKNEAKKEALETLQKAEKDEFDKAQKAKKDALDRETDAEIGAAINAYFEGKAMEGNINAQNKGLL